MTSINASHDPAVCCSHSRQLHAATFHIGIESFSLKRRRSRCQPPSAASEHRNASGHNGFHRDSRRPRTAALHLLVTGRVSLLQDATSDEVAAGPGTRRADRDAIVTTGAGAQSRRLRRVRRRDPRRQGSTEPRADRTLEVHRRRERLPWRYLVASQGPLAREWGIKLAVAPPGGTSRLLGS